MDENSENPASPRLTSRKVAGRALVNLGSFLLTGVIAATVILHARLAMGPVRLDALTPAIEARVNDQLNGWRAELGGAALSLNRMQREIAFTLNDLSLHAPDGERVAGAPFASMRFALGPAIRGVLAPTSLRLDGADAVLVREADGRFRFAMMNAGASGPDAAAPETAPPANQSANAPEPPELETGFAAIARFVEGLAGDRQAPPTLAEFERIEITKLNLTYRDEMSNQAWRAKEAELSVARTVRGLEAALNANLVIDPARPAVQVALSGRRPPEADAVALRARFQDAPAGAIASQVPRGMEALGAVSGLFSGAIDAEVSLINGDLLSLSAELAAEDVEIEAAELQLNEMAAAAAYDAQREELSLSRLALKLPGGEATLSGAARFQRGPDGAAAGAEIDLVLDSAVISDTALFETPVVVSGGEARLEIVREPFQATAPRWAVQIDDVAISGAAALREEALGGGGEPIWRGEVSGDLGALSVGDLKRLWPIGAAEGAREWVVTHLLRGSIDGGAFSARFGPVAQPGAPGGVETDVQFLDLTFNFSDLDSRYLEEMTPITGGVGSGRVGLDRFDLTVTGGTVDLGGGLGVLEIAGSRFAIPTLEPEIPPAEVDLVVDGPIKAALSLMDQQPLALISKLGLNPASVAGASRIEAGLRFPLAAALELEEIEVAAGADLKNVALTPPGLPFSVAARTGRLEADAAQLSLVADAEIKGAPAKVEWRETFSPEKGKPRSQFDVRARLDKAGLANLMGASPHFMGGAVAARLRARLIDSRPAALSLDLDLKDAALQIARIGWEKPAGVSGSARVEAAATAAETTISTLEAEIGTLRLSGGGRIDGEGRLGRLELTELAIGEGTELSLILAANAEDEWAVSVSGPKLDLRPAIAAAESGDDAEGEAEAETEETERTRPIRVEAAVRSVTLSDSTALREVAADALLGVDGGVDAQVKAIAQGPEGDRAPLEGRYVDDGERRRVVVESLQAGALLRALGYFDDGSEGRARIDASIEPGGAVAGALLMEDFVVKDAPELAQILSFATLFGIYDQLQSGGVSFSQVRAPFRLADGVLTIEEAAATGPSIGLTLSGVYRREDGSLDFTGSLSPAFAVNGLISGVPVIGDLLTGGSGEGVIGVAYSVTGSVSEPEVSVNPLSVFAPGPFRQLFQGGESDQEGLLPMRRYER